MVVILHDSFSIQGLTDILFKDQASLSLVSNGSELIMLNKKFYMENANYSLLNTLNEQVKQYDFTLFCNMYEDNN